MKNWIGTIVSIVAAAGILAYDYFAGQKIETWVYIVVGLLIASRLVAMFAKKTSKQ